MGHGIYAVPNRLERNTAMQVDSAGDLQAPACCPCAGTCFAVWSGQGGCGGLCPLRHQDFTPDGGRGVSAGGAERAPRQASGLQAAWQHASVASARASVASARARVRGFRARTREGKSFLHQGFRCVCCMFFFVIALRIY